MKKTVSLLLFVTLFVFSVLTGGCWKSQEEIDAEYVKGVRKSAVSGNSTAQLELANIYARGLRHIDGNMSASIHWLYKVAEKGNPIVQYAVGRAYYYGEGVSKNEGEGIYWINRAAEQGNYEAEEFLRKVLPGHGSAPTEASKPFNWGYYASSAFGGDIVDTYGWVIFLGVVLIFSGVGSPIGLIILGYCMYQVA